MKKIIQKTVLWSIKNHWLFLILIIFAMWFTGEVMSGHPEWGAIISRRNARALHNFVSKIVILSVIGLALDKLYLFLKTKGKI